MSAEEIQARLEYVEAILASQTALLAPHIESLDVNAEILPNDPSPLKRQEDIEALHSFNKQESNKIMALLRQNYNGLIGDDIGHELQNVQADLRPSSITRSLDIPIEGAGKDTIQTADTETFATSSALEGPRIKRLRYTFEPGLSHSENGRNQVSTLPNRDAVLRDEEEVRTGELLVPPELMTVLIDEYFIRVHPLLPILHPTTFFENFVLYRSYRSEHPITSDTTSGTPNSASKVLAILHALVAATIGFISDDSEACRFPHLLILIQGEKRKTELRRTAFELVVAEAMDNPTFEILQALAIIVLASIGQGSPPFAWELTGMMCRMAVQLGLNHEPPSMHREDCAGKEIGQPFQPFVLPADFLPAPQDPIEAEHRRRVFWTIVMIDRICATGTGWSVALNRRDFDVDLPCPDYLWDNHIVSAGCRPSEKSAFRWGPDASVSEESSSPRVRIWTRKHEREHGKVIALSNDISTPGQASLLLGHRQASDEAFSDYSAPARDMGRDSSKTPSQSSWNAEQTVDNDLLLGARPLGPLATLIEAFEALSQIIAFIQQPANTYSFEKHIAQLVELDAVLKAWRITWPESIEELNYIDENGTSHMSPIKALIHAVYISSIIVLHQPFAHPFNGDLGLIAQADPLLPITRSSISASLTSIHDGTFSSSSEACARAIDEMETLIHALGADMPKLNPLMAFFIFISGRNKLVRVLRNAQTSHMRSEISTHLKALRSISTVWGLGHYFAEALEVGCTFVEANYNSFLAEKGAPGLFDLRIPAFSSRIFVSLP